MAARDLRGRPRRPGCSTGPAPAQVRSWPPVRHRSGGHRRRGRPSPAGRGSGLCPWRRTPDRRRRRRGRRAGRWCRTARGSAPSRRRTPGGRAACPGRRVTRPDRSSGRRPATPWRRPGRRRDHRTTFGRPGRPPAVARAGRAGPRCAARRRPTGRRHRPRRPASGCRTAAPCARPASRAPAGRHCPDRRPGLVAAERLGRLGRPFGHGVELGAVVAVLGLAS